MRLTILFISLCVAGAASAEADLYLDLGWERQTNITRVTENPVNANVPSYGGRFDWTDSGSNFDADVSYAYLQEQYDESLYGKRAQTSGDASLFVFTSDRSLGWTFNNRVEDTVVDVFSPELPTNLVNVNTYSTGPLVGFRLSRRDTLNIQATKSWVKTENGLGDSSSDLLRLNWSRSLSRRSDLTASVSTSTISPELETVADYDVQTARVAYNRRLPKGEWMFEAGLSDSDFTDANGSEVGGVAEYLSSLSYDLGRFGQYGLYLEKQFTSTGMASRGDSMSTPQGDSSFSAEINKVARASVLFTLLPQRLAYTLAYEKSDIEFLLAGRITVVKSLSNQLRLSFKNRSSLVLSYNTSDRSGVSALESEQTQALETVNVSYSWPISSKWNFRCEYENRSVADDIEENVTGCSTSYQIY